MVSAARQGNGNSTGLTLHYISSSMRTVLVRGTSLIIFENVKLILLIIDLLFIDCLKKACGRNITDNLNIVFLRL